MNDYRPIGFFDSGYGGLTVLNEVVNALSQYDYLYLGDNKRAPYGVKSTEEVFQYTWEGVQYLFDKGCELVILACNTASAKALRKIQQNKLIHYPGKRVLGVIRPSAEVVGDFSTTNQIVVLGTTGTVSSGTYLEEFNFFSPQSTVYQYACPKWVPLIEKGNHTSDEGRRIIKKDLSQLRKLYPDADVILLGCTHYPILQEYIREQIPKQIKIISQGELVASSLSLYLQRHLWLREKLSQHRSCNYLTTGNAVEFSQQVEKMFHISITANAVAI